VNRPATILAASVMALTLSANACSGDDNTTTSTAPTTSASVSTSGDPPPTTTSTTVTTTPSATSSGAPTTVDQIAATKQAVSAAAVQSRQDYLYAVRNYDAADALDVLARTTAKDGPSWALGIKNMETLRTHGWRSRENPSVPSVLSVESDVQLLDGPPATKAELTVCTIDSGVVYEPGAAPDGSDTIVNDEVTAIRDHITMVFDGGAWKLYQGTNVGSWSGATSCPAE
jgi:hypothetical protein